VGKLFDRIDPKLAGWISAQRLFFVATAPSGDDGHVNCSPKGGIETFRIVDPHTVAYADYVGSGAETIAHLRENGRIVIMLCAFEGPPRIVRLHGHGAVTQVGDAAYEELETSLAFDSLPLADSGRRSIVTVALERIADSCGYGVPRMSFEGARTQSADWYENRLREDPNAVVDYSSEKNSVSIDGLPAIKPELLPRR
jgi:hypothetical protein